MSLVKICKKVNKLTSFIVAFFLMMILQGCPYSSQFCIDTNPENPVDQRYLGKWKGNLTDDCGNSMPVDVTISRIDDYYYEFIFHGKFFDHPPVKKHFWQFRKKRVQYTGEDSVVSNAYISYVNGREILNLNHDDLNYLVEINYEKDQLSLLTIGEGFSSKLMLSDKELRKSLEYHFKSRLFPMYDEGLCLRKMTRVQ